MIIKNPIVPFGSDKNFFIRPILLHILMLLKQLLAHKQRLETLKVDSEIQKGYMRMLRNEHIVMQGIADLLFPNSLAEKTSKFILNFTDMLGNFLKKLDEMPTSDVSSLSIKVSKYVKSFDFETFIPPKNFDLSNNFRFKRFFSKMVFDLVHVYFSNKKKPNLLDWEKIIVWLEVELKQILRTIVGIKVDLSLYIVEFRTLGYFLWVHDRLFDNIKEHSEKGSLMTSMLPHLNSSRDAIKLTKMLVKLEDDHFGEQKVDENLLYTCAELVRFIAKKRVPEAK